MRALRRLWTSAAKFSKEDELLKKLKMAKMRRTSLSPSARLAQMMEQKDAEEERKKPPAAGKKAKSLSVSERIDELTKEVSK